ncbi:OB-fold domain-containing protein [Rhodococcus sp. LB1]|uniref:OB-fold domain-containing protein n=1 Tax=Rhodococcus sp. LB1 TaxID=1807499 RepID=UPI00077AE0FD|nr:OB-fold domain-containing protein [Rhodococcus sp. LB1]KXX58818.1 hydroxymethylglutaryl-CoA synthase [Rhodococcus sp. LB1]
MSTTPLGVTGYGVYLPLWRVDRKDIGSALGTPAGRGTRSVAGYDEDSTSMGVEAALAALDGAPAPAGLVYATATPGYADKTNAGIVHAALALDQSVPAWDFSGAARSGMGVITAAADAAAAGRPTLAVLSDIRTGLPSSAEEKDGGDGASALLFGTGDGVVAELIGRGSASAEFLDRWRVPGETASKVWEERFAEGIYRELALDAVDAALKEAGLTRSDVDRVGVAGLHRRAVGVVTKTLASDAAVIDDLAATVGATGTAQPGILLASALDDAAPGETILIVQLGDGADAVLLRTTAALATYRDARTTPGVAEQLGYGRTIGYQRFLTWRGFLRRESPRRPDPDRPAAPPSSRNAQWKFGLAGSRCTECGTRHMPAIRVCRSCKAVDRMERERIAGERGTIATYQADLLAYTLSPPLIGSAIDFDGGGRLMCEITDADAAALKIGDPVEMTFRRFYTTSDGVHNYFWKARPARGAVAATKEA